MSNYMTNEELQHYGVPGMKWGVRKARGHAGPGRYATRKRQLEGDRRDLELLNKGGHLSVGVTKKSQARLDNRDRAAIEKRISKNESYFAKKAANDAADRKIADARQKQSDAKTGVKNAAKDYALATLAGDKNAKMAARKSASKMINSYINSDAVAKQATSGEKKVALAIAAVGTTSLAVAAARHAQVGKRTMNVVYPGLHNVW